MHLEQLFVLTLKPEFNSNITENRWEAITKILKSGERRKKSFIHFYGEMLSVKLQKEEWSNNKWKNA